MVSVSSVETPGVAAADAGIAASTMAVTTRWPRAVLSPPQILTLLSFCSVALLSVLLKAVLNCSHGLGPLVAG